MSIHKTPQPHKALTFTQILKLSPLPRLETEILVAFLLKKTREFLITHPEIKINPAILRRFHLLEKKRLANWPIAYLTGHKEFYGLDFKVSPATLVPRPETEMIVDIVVDIAEQTHGTRDGHPNALKIHAADKNPRGIQKKIRSDRHSFLIIDLGTGSGAIIIAIAAALRQDMPTIYKRTEFLAGDISYAALQLAQKNAAKHKLGKRIVFKKGNLLTPFTSRLSDALDHDMIITANLPYLTPRQIKDSPSIAREPKLALDGGSDGLKYYRRLFSQLAKIKTSAGRTITVFCEIDPSQAKKITALSKKYFPKAKNTICLDLAKQKRLLITKIRF
ncbi:MAG: HemK/PrmC family methyltransferase [Patescibacteria group bacterium]